MLTEANVLAERTVPRYTSYPTAPQFTTAVNPDVYAGWLGELPHDARLSLYLHVPFCAQICLYCGCHTKAVRRRDPVDAYALQLAAEIALVGAHAASRRLARVHWGGGTPSILGEEGLAELIGKIGGTFSFEPDLEHAIELDPRYVTPLLARELAAAGINRASLGVQDFSDHVQETIGRVQPFAQVERAVGILREAGIANINIDLMYGLPQQSKADVARTAALAAQLKPQRLAVFGYAHVPWFKTHQRLIEKAGLPGPVERLQQAETARATLVAAGYEAIGLDHFALPGDALAVAARAGTLHRNFQGYTDDDADALIGIGASSIGRLPQGFVQNAPDIGGYGRAIAAGRLATAKGLAFSNEDHVRGHIIERLMCDLKVDVGAVADDFAVRDRFARELEALAPLQQQGLVEVEDERVVMTDQGRPFVRLVAAAFDAHLPNSNARHSVSV
jgi:oxygen-independent coproporphyrinogen III oxidase